MRCGGRLKDAGQHAEDVDTVVVVLVAGVGELDDGLGEAREVLHRERADAVLLEHVVAEERWEAVARPALGVVRLVLRWRRWLRIIV